jgi:hypothetical protein
MNKTTNLLLIFLEKIEDDPVIDSGHIAIYLALYRKWLLGGYSSYMRIKSSRIMKEAKISSSATYSKKIRELAHLKYIGYFPDHCRRKGTMILLE